MNASTADRTIVQTRHYRAPPDLVFEAWTRPEHVDRWMGPHGYTTTTQSMDLRVGGQWLFTMVHAEHGTFPNRVRYLEIVPGERLVYDHDGGEEDEARAFRVTVTFESDANGGTNLTMRSLFSTVEQVEQVKSFGAVELGQQTLARLGEALDEDSAGDFVYTRLLAAPRELVWRAWTDPAHLARWWGPRGMDIAIAAFDLRPGGVCLYSMSAPTGHPMAGTTWGRFVFRQIIDARRLVWINAFSDAQGGLGRHPLAPTVPAEILNIVTLEDEDGQTRLELRSRPLRASTEERATFAGMFASMRGGFGGTFEQLAAHLGA